MVQMTEQTNISLIEHPQPTHTVLGLPLHVLRDYTQWLSDCIIQQLGVHVVTLNAEMAMQADQDGALATVIRNSEMVVPDGQGLSFTCAYADKRFIGVRGSNWLNR